MLAEYSLKLHRQYLDMPTKELEVLLDGFVTERGNEGMKAEQIVNPLINFSPVFHTVTLFWVCKFQEIEDGLVQVIIDSF